MNIEETAENLKKYISFSEKECNFPSIYDWNWHMDLANDIETLLTAYEKEKGENVKLRLQDIPLIEGELKAYKDRVNELKIELEKEKEKVDSRESFILYKEKEITKLKNEIYELKKKIYAINLLSNSEEEQNNVK